MSREIKFRAWDLDRKQMRGVMDVKWFDDGAMRVNATESQTAYEPRLKTKNVTEFVLMQFTGLTDRNGNEIYEGDIVTAREKSNTATFTGYVHFLNGQYWVNYIGYESYYVPLIQLVNAVYEPIEIVGNVYQDKHLLEENGNISHD